MTQYDQIQLKRIYEKAEQSDGMRLLADRIWPRGVKKSDLAHDEWIKNLCPSNSLRKAWHNQEVSYREFEDKYRKELSQQTDDLIRLAKETTQHTLTLLSAVKNIERSHLPILKKTIMEQIEENEFNLRGPASSPVCYSPED